MTSEGLEDYVKKAHAAYDLVRLGLVVRVTHARDQLLITMRIRVVDRFLPRLEVAAVLRAVGMLDAEVAVGTGSTRTLAMLASLC